MSSIARVLCVILAWGAFRFLQGEIATDITHPRQFDDANNAWAELRTWQINGRLNNPTGSLATMTKRIRAMEAAFALDNQDLILYAPTGERTAHALLNADCIGGTKVTVAPSYPDSQGAQYVTYRDFTVTVQGLVPIAGDRSPLKSFQESIQFSGGGPLTHHLEPLVGAPIKQLGKQQTVYRAVQSGSAVGILARPNLLAIAPPIWPGQEVRPLRTITPGTPKRQGNTFIDWPISWQYTFEAATELVGEPNLWVF